MDLLTDEQFTTYANRYMDTVYRTAYHCLASRAEAEDVTQEVFLKLLGERKTFESDEHVRNWLVRVTVNTCRNVIRSRWWNHVSIEGYPEPAASERSGGVLESVLALPAKYRVPIYLFYYEGYSTQEVAAILKIPKNTVCTRLKRAREMLKIMIEEERGYV